MYVCVCVVHSAVSDFRVPWTVASRLLCSWNFPGKITGVVCHFLLQGIDPGIKYVSCIACIADRFFTAELPGKPTHED